MPVEDLKADERAAELPEALRRLIDLVARLDDRLLEHIATNAREHIRIEARVNSHEHRIGAVERRRNRM
jgi:hypothetical protein